MVRVGDFDRFLFVVGAPRCGTTTLSQFLKGHPAVAFPAVKEPHFFAQNDLRGVAGKELRQRVEEQYLNRFFRDDPALRVGADCSVTYLYTPEQLEPVLRLWPDSRFVVALRDPMTMLPSLHQRLVFMGDENLTSFAKAWAATPDRAAGRRIPRSCVEPRWLRYDEAARFGTYVERLFAVVGKERCEVVIFDNLRADPQGQYERFMEFCGLEPIAETNVSPHRPSKGVRVPWLQRLLKRPPASVRNYLATDNFLHVTQEQDRPNSKKSRGAIMTMRKRLLEWNRISAPAQPIPVQVQRDVRAHYKDEIGRLSALIGRDLSHWLRVEESTAAEPRTEESTGAASRAVSQRRA